MPCDVSRFINHLESLNTLIFKDLVLFLSRIGLCKQKSRSCPINRGQSKRDGKHEMLCKMDPSNEMNNDKKKVIE